MYDLVKLKNDLFKLFVELSADRNVTLDVEDKHLGDRNHGSRLYQYQIEVPILKNLMVKYIIISLINVFSI